MKLNNNIRNELEHTPNDSSFLKILQLAKTSTYVNTI